jgi:hypothetical protein
LMAPESHQWVHHPMCFRPLKRFNDTTDESGVAIIRIRGRLRLGNHQK